MTPDPSDPYERAVRAVAEMLAALPGPSMFIGGLAVIAHGYVRTTDDIDATASGARVTPELIADLAVRFDIHPRIDRAVEFARSTQVLLLEHRPTRVKIDLSLAWLPFEEEALSRQVVVRFRDLDLHMCDPEDLIIYKVVAARPIDLEDARQLAMRHHTRIDRVRVRRTLAAFDDVLDDSRSRLELWQAIEASAFPSA